MPRRLVLIAAALLAAAALAVIARVDLDADRFKPRVETAFQRATGHALHLSGPLRLRLLPSPTIVADDVSIDNLPGGTRPEILTARRLTAVLDLPALIGRVVAIESLTCTDADITLENVRGAPNWGEPNTGGPSTVRPARAAGPASDPSTHRSALTALREIDILRGRLAWHDLGRLGSGEVSIDHLSARQDRTTLTLSAAGRHGRAGFTVSLATSPIERFRDRQFASPLPLRAVLTIGHASSAGRLGIDGSVTSPVGGFVGRVHANLPQLDDLNALLPHARLPSASLVRLDASVAGDPVAGWRLTALRASGSHADLGRVHPGLTIDRLDVSASGPASRLSVSTEGTVDAKPFKINGTAGSLDLWTRITSEAPFDLGASFGTDGLAIEGSLSRRAGEDELRAHLALSAPDPAVLSHLLGRTISRPLFVNGVVHATSHANDAGGSLEASMLRIGTADLSPTRVIASFVSGHLLVQAALGTRDPPWLTWREDPGSTAPAATLDLDGHDLPAAALSTLLAGQPVVSGQLTIRAALRGRPHGVGLERSTLTGPVSATLTNGELAPSIARDLLGDVLHTARLPKIEGSDHLNCATGQGEFQDGTLRVQRFALDTPLLTLTGSGDLGTDGELDVRLKPVLRLGVTDVETAVALTGSIDHPDVALAPQTGGRFGLTIGRLASATPDSCPQPPAGRRKPPKAADVLRAFGLFR